MNLLSHINQTIRNYFKSIDLVFFIFLLLVLNVSLPLKVAGVIMIYLIRFDLKSVFRYIKSGALPKFYLLMMLLSGIIFTLNFKYWNLSYLVITCFGICLWGLNMLILNQLKLTIDKIQKDKIHQTLVSFFILNAVFSLFTLIYIIILTKNLNPYTYEGMDLKYNASTGDNITGILFDFSSTNSIINVFGLIYFLYKKNNITSLLCFIVVLITTSNTIVIFLIITLIIMIFFNKSKLQKSICFCYIFLIIIFFAKISPTNTEYVSKQFSAKEKTSINVVKAPVNIVKEQVLTEEQIKRKKTELFQKYYLAKHPKINLSESKNRARNSTITKAIAETYIHEKEIQSASDAVFKDQMKKKKESLASNILYFYHDSTVSLDKFQNKKYPGKLISCIQTLNYSVSSIKHFFVGAGTGMFSSKMAFKASCIGMFGKYPKQLQYVSNDFLENHLKVYCYFFSKDVSEHSVTNTPFSVYNQLLGEYGIIGVIIFLIYYVWFFFKRYKKLTYGRYILPLCLIFLIFDYWFEHLSIIIIFELFMLIDIKEQTENNDIEVNID